jgi:hypothetical protein
MKHLDDVTTEPKAMHNLGGKQLGLPRQSYNPPYLEPLFKYLLPGGKYRKQVLGSEKYKHGVPNVGPVRHLGPVRHVGS